MNSGYLDHLPEIRPLVIAHRFGNQPQTLRLAEQAGADLIEADVWLYRNRLEVRHSKTLGPVPVLWDFWSLEPGWRPRRQLSDLLAEKSAETRLLLDLKGRSPDIAEILMETIRHSGHENQLIVCSQNWTTLDRLARYSEVARFYSIGSRRQLANVWSHLAKKDNDHVSIDARILDPATMLALKERVSTVISWPVNTTSQLERVLDWGVDGFTSDNLDLIRTCVQRRISSQA